ncbi:ATP-binding protein [Siccirubricoccus sp. G192]|uniref:ATP-binding protein n=1 Tax=Siccirubricoccus sp. G192 TaxID=2849651 RepID=UPI001C2BBA6F|nr:ATP-binding protein [Siccirubricoccus sp. G192]MBV1796509.1 response regulator [Siccirubricoccus sp. G192]
MTKEAELQTERVRAAFEQIPVAALATMTNAALMVAVLVADGQGSGTYTWLGAAVLVAAARLAAWWAYRRAGPAIAQHRRWSATSICGALAAGLLWGGGSVLLFPQTEIHQLFWAFVIAGMCAGAAALHYAHLPSALAFIIPAGGLLAIRFALEGSGRRFAAAAMIGVFLVVLVVTVRRSSRYFGETLRLRLDLAERTRELDVSNAKLRTEMAEHRATEASLRHAQKMEAVGQLAGGIAHDFNNVLQAVSGGIGLIHRRAGDRAAVERLTGMVEEAARRGASVTRRLLAFSRREELRPAALDAGELLGGLREVLSATLGPRIRVEVEAEPGLPPVLADRGQLETVLVNLATNARDAMPDGGTLTLSTRMHRAGGEGGPGCLKGAGPYVHLAIADTGQGMSADTLARASEPFFTTKPQGQGTGLGLAMARSFAKGSGGALAIASEPGQGTTVSLWLPVTDREPSHHPSPASADWMPPPAGQGRRPRVLLVDDEPVVREVLAAQLGEMGYEVAEGGDGAAALDLLDRGAPFDILVSDLAMPGMDGVALIRAAQGRRPGLPAILVTGYAGDAAALAVGAAVDGTFALLREPVTAQQLADQVAASLATAPAARLERTV